MLAKILLVDDNPRVLESLVGLFEDDYQLLTASSGPESIAHAQTNADVAVVVMDIKMEGMDGIVAAQKIREILPKVMVIFHTGYPGDYDEQRIDRAEKPFDYIDKGQSATKLVRSVRNAVEAYKQRNTGRVDARPGGPQYGLVGKSQAILQIIRDIEKIAPQDNKVMIRGASGTGKEVVAIALHQLSPRKDRQFKVLHCNHKSADLVESELFGHVRGAFTGAVADRVGLFEFANEGTIFLDEIGDLDITTQAKLLRVLQSGEFNRIGEAPSRFTNARVLCATNKNLEAMVEKGTFRDDLYFRLKGIRITLPPLCERKEDIPLLVDHFVSTYISDNKRLPMFFDQPAMEQFIAYDWPGNVRELMEAVYSILTLSYSDVVGASEVESYLKVKAEPMPDSVDPTSLAGKVEAYKCALIVTTLRHTGGNFSSAAYILKCDKSNLRKYVIDHNLQWE